MPGHRPDRPARGAPSPALAQPSASPQVDGPAAQRVHAPAVPGGVRLAAQGGIAHHAVKAEQPRHGQLHGVGW